NGTENFWSFSKWRLAQFNSVSRETLCYLKKYEFCYSYKDDIMSVLEKIIRSYLV
ncbi:MAG: IS1595 family transposase, partial [Candidatus Yonathbacteria bacterium CG_4_9_14_0_8_um_filter_46_47]